MGIRQEAIVHGNTAIRCGDALCHGCQDHSRAGREGHNAGSQITCTDHAGKVIQRSRIDLHISADTEFLSCFLCQRADHRIRFYQGWQLGMGNTDSIQHILPVALVVNVEIEGEGGDGHIAAHLTGKQVHHIVLQEHITAHIVIHIGAVIL